MKWLKYNKNDSLIRDGIILFSATMIANVLGYAYHFAAGRLLGPVQYGILGAVLSLIYIVNVPVNVIQTTIAKFSAKFKAEQHKEKVNVLLRRSVRKLLLTGITATLIFLVLIGFIADFLKIPKEILLLFTPILLFSLLLPITRGILQGLQSFKDLGLNLVSEGFVKMALGIGFVLLGLGVGGAVLGITCSLGIAFLLSYFPLKNFFKKTHETFERNEVYNYALPVFFALLLLTGFYTVDVLLVKHFFQDIDAGYYAALSLIGKMIFFGTFAIGNVMFPKVAEMHSLKKENKQILNKSLILMTLGSFAAVSLYFLFPKIIILLLFGKEYLRIIPLVGWMGVMMAFYSLSYLLSLYNLSIGKLKFIWILFVFFLIEVLALVLFHQNLESIIKILAALMTVLFLILLIYTKAYGTEHYHSSI